MYLILGLRILFETLGIFYLNPYLKNVNSKYSDEIHGTIFFNKKNKISKHVKILNKIKVSLNRAM